MSNLERDYAAIRNEFPMHKKLVHRHPLVYLDSAATSQKPDVVIDTVADFYRHHYSTVHRSVYRTAVEAGELYQNARKKVAAFLNAKSDDEIVFTRGTTDAINLVAHSFSKVFIGP